MTLGKPLFLELSMLPCMKGDSIELPKVQAFMSQTLYSLNSYLSYNSSARPSALSARLATTNVFATHDQTPQTTNLYMNEHHIRRFLFQ